MTVSETDPRAEVERFYTALEQLSKRYVELTDTDVRDALHRVLNYYFVWDNNPGDVPRTFGMFSSEADSEVSQVVSRFLSHRAIRAFRESAPAGDARLRLLQDKSILTPDRRQYDEFIGHVDKPLPNRELPRQMFEPGHYARE